MLELTPSGIPRRVKKNLVARAQQFFAVVQPGFEEVSLREMTALACTSPVVISPGGIEWTGNLDEMYRVNLFSRTVNRVLMRLFRCKAMYFTEILERAGKFPWEIYLPNNVAVRFEVTCHKCRLYHSDGVADRLAAGMRARFSQFGFQLEVADKDTVNCQTIYVRGDNNRFEVSLDTSGELLYRRGYKTHTVFAPLRETIAAAILLAADREEYSCVVDPMCGSGTFSLEMALLSGLAPGLPRAFAFEGWPSFRPQHVAFLKTKGQPFKVGSKKLWVGDLDAAAVKAARENFSQLGVSDIPVHQQDFFALVPPPGENCLLVLNPPYGKRLALQSVRQFYRKLGAHLRKVWQGSGFAILVPSSECVRELRLPVQSRVSFSHGGLRTQVVMGTVPAPAATEKPVNVE